MTFVKSSLFWAITPYSSLKVNQRFGGKYRPHLESRRISQEKKNSMPQVVGFFLGLFINPEHRGDMFLRKVS
jgi:hypothetical protein